MASVYITEYNDYCAICGKRAEAKHHLIFGTGLRALAEEDGLTLPLCNECHDIGVRVSRVHDNPMAERLSKICGQLAYEKAEVAVGASQEDARVRFRTRYGRSYL